MDSFIWSLRYKSLQIDDSAYRDKGTIAKTPTCEGLHFIIRVFDM